MHNRRGLRYDIDAILDDPRNWRGAKAQKEQALLRQVVRQSNAPERFHRTASRRPGWTAFNLAAVEAYTGIKRETAVPLLVDLARRGFLSLDVENPGTRRAVYRVKLDRRAERWPVKQHHRTGDLGDRDCPF